MQGDQAVGSTGQTAPYGIAILAFNEEQALPGLLDSVPRDVPLLVIDSGSVDRTQLLAKTVGATVLVNPFTGFGDQRNYAIEAAGGLPDWQLHLDADERMTPALDAAIRAVINRQGGPDAYAIPNKLMLNGKWIRRSSGYPVYQVRLVRRSAARFINLGHGQQEAPGTAVERLEEPYVHHAFIHGAERWLMKHAHYAAKEAELELSGATRVRILELVHRDSTVRRRALRDLSRRLPFKGLLQMVRILILKGGLLDGRQGLTYARMLAVYEGMKDILRDEAFTGPRVRRH